MNDQDASRHLIILFIGNLTFAYGRKRTFAKLLLIGKILNIKRIILLLFVILFCETALAEITPGPAARKSGDLGLVIVASDTPDYIKKWLSTPSSQAVTIKRLKKAKPNQLIVTAFLVTGLSANKDGNYNFSVSFYLLDPNKKSIFGKKNYAKGMGKHPNKPMLTMADPALDIVLENNDPEGIYTIVAQVKDLVSGKKADDSYKIRFVKN